MLLRLLAVRTEVYCISFVSFPLSHRTFLFAAQTTIGSKALLGNQATSVLRDAAEEVITILKDPSLRDPDRHDQISRLLTGKAPSTRGKVGGGITSEQYATFVQLGKDLDDYEDVSRKRSSGRREDASPRKTATQPIPGNAA